MKAHLLFEQSGTFKKQFIKHGIEAFDYDISDKLKQTDIVCNLFIEIERAYLQQPSIFDKISSTDIIMAFFPCTKFDEQIKLWFRGDAYSMIHWTEKEKLIYSISLHNDLNKNYITLSKLVLIALEKKYKLIIENPYSKSSYLANYWCCKPSIIHKDRRLYGDYYKKPTQFFFFNIEPHDNIVTDIKDNSVGGYQPMVNMSSAFYKNNANNKFIARSMIAPDYANYFIEKYIL